NAPEFNGRLELSFSGSQNGKPWASTLPGGGQALRIKQYGRIEGAIETGLIPAALRQLRRLRESM
ncbi:MAG: hypothetical protein NTZ30_12290, partial [Planctomycetota bacterium]|nr:hypothetical protein [Planctomycetota bacterium]